MNDLYDISDSLSRAGHAFAACSSSMTAAAQAAAASCIEINRIIETVEHYRRSPAFRKLAGIRRKYRHGLKKCQLHELHELQR
ncbi:hypothetical protein [Alistipes indistinctus]|uniref:hypothetical protein n=1 Tax=Alistipes indistinctus TaxID=626932 RepID=UPI00241C54F9|nr:hypothetical protein [Alistipes indistinctus]